MAVIGQPLPTAKWMIKWFSYILMIWVTLIQKLWKNIISLCVMSGFTPPPFGSLDLLQNSFLSSTLK
jgi:hypothetical protein